MAELPERDAGLLLDMLLAARDGQSFVRQVFYRPTLITDEVVRSIQELSALAPLHNPANVTGIESVRALLPRVV